MVHRRVAVRESREHVAQQNAETSLGGEDCETLERFGATATDSSPTNRYDTTENPRS